jgi:hypothetical protein
MKDTLDCDVIINATIDFDYCKPVEPTVSEGQNLPGEHLELDKIKVLIPIQVKTLQDALERSKPRDGYKGIETILVDVWASLDETEQMAIESECAEHASIF